MKNYSYESINYNPANVAGMSEADFIDQHKDIYFVGHPNQNERLKAFYAEAAKENKAITDATKASDTPAKGVGSKATDEAKDEKK